MDSLGRGDRGPPFFVEGKPPLLKLAQPQPLSLEKGRELDSREFLRRSEDADLLIDQPGLRLAPWRRHERQATCITQPPRQSLLRDASLLGKRPRADRLLPGQLLDHLLLERQRERFRHAAIASSPHWMNRVKRQLRWHRGSFNCVCCSHDGLRGFCGVSVLSSRQGQPQHPSPTLRRNLLSLASLAR